MSEISDLHEELIDELRSKIAQLTKERDELKARKPCYCLGSNTIQVVANEGQLETESVNFVAASDLFRKDPYIRAEIAERERNELRIGLAHAVNERNEAVSNLVAERDELATKCASLHQALGGACGQLQWVTSGDVNGTPCAAYFKAIKVWKDHDQCGTGWLSPEKAGRLREALRSMVTQLEQEEIRTNFPFTSKLISEIGRKALEDCK